MEQARFKGIIKRTELIALALCIAVGASLYFTGTASAQFENADQTYLDDAAASLSLNVTQGACGSGQITLQWATVAGAQGYRLARNGSDVIYQGGAPTYTDTGLQAGSTYNYYLTVYANGLTSNTTAYIRTLAPAACVSGGTLGSGSTTTTTTTTANVPSAPTNLTASFSQFAGGIVLSWNTAGSPYGIKIQRRLSGGSFSDLQTLTGSQTTHTDSSSLAPGTTYEYQVIACASAGCSGASNIASATTPAATSGSSGSSATSGTVTTAGTSSSGTTGSSGNTSTSQILETFIGTSGHAPAQPGLSVSSPSGCGTFALYLSWGAVAGVTSYEIYRDNAFIISTINTTYADSGLPPGTQHEYRVTAKNSYGSAASTNVSSIVPPACAVAATTTPTTTTTQPVPVLQPPATPTVVEHTMTTSGVEQPKTVTQPKTQRPAASAPAPVQITPAYTAPSTAAPNDVLSAVPPPVSPETATSLQTASQSVIAVQTAISDAVTDLIAQIDAHIQSIHGGGNASVAQIRESLIGSIKSAITGAPSQEDIARLKPMLESAFARMDAAVGPSQNGTPVAVSIDALAEAAQNANRALQASGAIDLYKDSNGDGISDYDSVHVYHIDPLAHTPSSPGTAGAATLTAGEKILQGYDPTAQGLVKVTYEEPAVSQAPEAPVYKVENVALTEEKKVQLEGTALPNSYVTLYIYSTPVIVTVKADSDGRWKYTVDRELESGRHTVYAATVDNSGRILAKSVAVPFTQTAEAATLDTVTVSPEGNEPGLLNNPALLPLILLSALFVFGVLYVIGKDFSAKNDVPPVA